MKFLLFLLSVKVISHSRQTSSAGFGGLFFDRDLDILIPGLFSALFLF